uniref:Capsid protein n=1 Tax=Torque teno mini virus 10 TaxID=2065036 RepID=A0A3S8RKC6_9VIRU|nr:hypothetical protein ORF2 [Torque teno mini virus 10]
MYHPKIYNQSKIQLAFTNLAIGNHDLTCDCSEQANHTLRILTKQIGPELTQHQKKEINQCLGTAEDTDADEPGEEEEIEFGKELEELFNIADTVEDAG